MRRYDRDWTQALRTARRSEQPVEPSGQLDGGTVETVDLEYLTSGRASTTGPTARVLIQAINRRGKAFQCRVSVLPLRSEGASVGGAIRSMEDAVGSLASGSG